MSVRTESLFGTDEAEPPARSFAAGPLAFEIVAGNIRAVRVGGIEIIRAIQYLVRDRDWATLAPALSEVSVDEGEDGIRIRYAATCRNPDGAALDYVATIEAASDRLDFSVEAVAAESFATNRLGFCVLHPAALAGTAVRVEHGDGSVEAAAFPLLIDPRQVFTDISALTHDQGGIKVECRLEGDTFEMEDQRNWSDASFKTYVRPLARPWPYRVPAGTRDRQRVSLRIRGAPPKRVAESGAIALAIGDPIGSMMRIGLVVTPAEAEATLARADALARSGVGDLLLSFNAAAGDGAAEMDALARVGAAARARLTLECVLACAGDLDEELRRIANHAAEAGLAPDSLAVFPAADLQSTPPGSPWPDCPPLADVYAAARRAFPGVALGGGMYGYFTELNRKRPPLESIDFVAHATCPIVHAADDLGVMQTLEALPHILRSARAIIGDKPYRLGPSTIGMRQNPYGSRTMANCARRRMPMAHEDPRQAGRYAAAWTIGYAAATEQAGLDLLTLGGLTGPRGLIGEAGPRPVFRAVQDLAAMSGGTRLACRSSAPGKVAAVASAGHGRVTVLVANLTPDEQVVAMCGRAKVTLDAYATRKIAM
jgi:hypothetical protein